MKTYFCIFIVLWLGSTGLLWAAAGSATQPTPGQTATVPVPTPFAVTRKDANSSVWERTIYESDPAGHVVAKKHHYTELSTGLHYWSNGRWLDSQELINILPNGTAVATTGQHQVSFPGDIYSGQIEVVTPDGVQMYSRPMGLSYYDGTNSVLIAELTNSIGVVVGSNQVVYPDAFTDFKADLVYTYTKAGFEQDVVLREQPPSPTTYGFDLQSTRLEMLTEFFNTPDPTSKPTPVNPGDGLRDRYLKFGNMIMGRGKAFLASDPVLESSDNLGIPVYKSWEHMEGRTFLVEDVPVKRIGAQLEQLPVPANANTSVTMMEPGLHQVSATRLLPPSRLVQASNDSGQLARAKMSQQPGVVLDYVEFNTDTNDITFQGDTTYLISGGVNLYGASTFEGGTVIKYDVNTPSIIQFWGTIICKTAPYRPAVLTSMNDNSVGENISGSGPMDFYQAIAEGGADGDQLSNLRISHADYGVHTYNVNMNDCQFVDCQSPIRGEWGKICLTNVLMVNVGSAFDGTYYTANACHLTVDGCTNQLTTDWEGSGLSSVSLVNSLLVNVGADGDASVTTNYTARLTAASSTIFQTVGGGDCYLATNSPYRNAGTTNIDPSVLADLQTKTTYPPIVYTSTTISTPTTLSPQAQRDTDMPDLGYHYDPLDYVFSGVEAQSNITFTAGTAVGWYDLTWAAGFGIEVDNGATVAFNGTVTAPCWLARYDMSQEGGNGNCTTVGWGFAITSNGGNGNYAANSPQVISQFTKFSSRNFNDLAFRDYNGFLVIRANDCEFWDAGSGDYTESGTYTNCFFFRIPPALYDAYGVTGCSFTMVNCTVEGGVQNSLYVQHYPGHTWPATIYNCAFDGTTYTVDTTDLTCDYNSFLTNAARLPISGAHDVIVTPNYNWQSSWFGDYYLPSDSSLIDAGSTTADQLGLYHFTTQTSQTVEGMSQVDIGYHYVATDAYGNPLDYDTDGIPDYLEDANGNGLVDSGETDWQSATDMGLKVWITRPKQNSIMP